MSKQMPLTAVDRVEVLTVIDNVMDVLLPSTAVAKRMGTAAREGQVLPRLEAPLLEEGYAADSPFAEHGLSFLVTVFVDEQRHSLLLDTGATWRGCPKLRRRSWREAARRTSQWPNTACPSWCP